MAAYEAARARGDRAGPVIIGASRTLAGSLDAAIVRYYASDDFTLCPKDARDQHRQYLEKWRAGNGGRGKRPLRQLQHKHVQAYVSEQATPTVERNVLRSIRHLMKFCLRVNLLDADPSANVIKRKRINTGGFPTWTEDHVAKYVARWPLGTKQHLALQLMLCTSLRQSDARQIGPRDVRKNAEHPHGIIADYQPVKGRRTGGRLVNIPLHPDLVAAIDAMDVIGSDTFLLNDSGKPYSRKHFTESMRAWCDAAGIPPIVDVTGKAKNVASHGLRKLCLSRLAELPGATVQAMQGISGHKDMAELQIYIEAANRKKLAAQLMKDLIAAQGAAGKKANVVCLTGSES
jgi:integrase